MGYKLILGSQSPRRKEMFDWLGLPFEQMSSDCEEVSNEKNPDKIAIDIADKKASDIRQKVGNIEQTLIVSSDTIVIFRNQIFGKPNSVDEARKMLLTLRGAEHEVLTSVVFNLYESKKIRKYSFCETSKVKFWNFSEEVLEQYLNTKDSLDKAGAYGIQGPGMSLIEKLNGSYSNVVGFPLNRFIEELQIFISENSLWENKFEGVRKP